MFAKLGKIRNTGYYTLTRIAEIFYLLIDNLFTVTIQRKQRMRRYSPSV